MDSTAKNMKESPLSYANSAIWYLWSCCRKKSMMFACFSSKKQRVSVWSSSNRQQWLLTIMHVFIGRPESIEQLLCTFKVLFSSNGNRKVAISQIHTSTCVQYCPNWEDTHKHLRMFFFLLHFYKSKF